MIDAQLSLKTQISNEGLLASGSKSKGMWREKFKKDLQLVKMSDHIKCDGWKTKRGSLVKG